MTWLWGLLAILAGISNPLQSGSNSGLLKTMGAPIVAAFVVYGVGSFCLLLAAPIVGFPLRESLGKLSGAPWWALIGGLCNVFFLLCTLIVTKRLGSATFTTLVVIAAILTSLTLDHFGLLGFESRPATTGRLIGSVLAIAGVICIALF